MQLPKTDSVSVGSPQDGPHKEKVGKTNNQECRSKDNEQSLILAQKEITFQESDKVMKTLFNDELMEGSRSTILEEKNDIKSNSFN